MLKKLIFPILLCLSTTGFSQNTYKMLVGTYTRGTTSEGIYSLEINKQGQLIFNKLPGLFALWEIRVCCE